MFLVSMKIEDNMATRNSSDIPDNIDDAMLETRPLEELEVELDTDPSTFVSRSVQAQDFSAYYVTDTDTDTENSVLPRHRRWVWYCKLRSCPKYYSAWTCKSNFLIHIYESTEHREDDGNISREGRRQFVKSCREETAYDLSEPKTTPPQDDDANPDSV
ncbi:hypothetical protein EIK77_000910 [Talaromyces pinophilus]|nr:hypothetical protein EIK77_000910 [Talaromyces pinophilus]